MYHQDGLINDVKQRNSTAMFKIRIESISTKSVLTHFELTGQSFYQNCLCQQPYIL